MKKINIILIILLLFSYILPVSAITVNVVSPNEKNIQIYNVSSLSMVNNGTNNQNIELSKDNYVVKVITTSSKFNINSLLDVGDKVGKDYIFIFFFIVCIVVLAVALKVVKKL